MGLLLGFIHTLYSVCVSGEYADVARDFVARYLAEGYCDDFSIDLGGVRIVGYGF